MNKTAIKNFAVWARNKLLADVRYRAGLIGITEKGIADPLPQSTSGTKFFDIGATEPYAITGSAIHQRERLVETIHKKEKDSDYATAYKYILEEVAYTWFNRLIAIRFMEVNDYLPSHIRVLSSESGKMEPDLVTTPFDAELEFSSDEELKIISLKQENKLDEVFRILFIKQCNALNKILPALFEKTENYTELLLNLSVIDQDGVVYHLIHDIPEDDFNIERGGQVEIIGWLYQYYNTEPKAEAFAKKSKITKEEIPAVTQLFTPDWIVRYMVENSLGRLWVEGHPEYNYLKENWKYYLEEAEQEPEVQEKLVEIRKEYSALNPEDIKLIDPCMGSGHILVYAFDVLMQIYESAGYSEREAAKSILENNIYGLDIDDRAYQLAYFAVMMKARQYNRRVLNGENACHVYAIQESNDINRDHLQYFGISMSDTEKTKAKEQMTALMNTMVDAKEYGSILNVEDYDWKLLKQFVDDTDNSSQISMFSFGVEETKEQLNELLNIGETMARKYWITCTNPPYAGTSNLSPKVNKFVKDNYPDSKADLFAVFIEKCQKMTKKNGYQAMITQHAWMFLSSFEKLRTKMMARETVNMAHLGARAFEEIGGEVVQTTSFVIRKSHITGYKGEYCRLIEPTSQQGKEDMFLAGENRFAADQSNFSKIPGSPVAYWVADQFLAIFKNKTIADFCEIKQGLATCNNALFLRNWSEVSLPKIGFDYMTNEATLKTECKWFPYNKGGGFRKWYGNNYDVVNWYHGGVDIHRYNKIPLDFQAAPVRAKRFYFKSGITYGLIASTGFSARNISGGYIFDVGGSMIFPSVGMQTYLLAFLSTKIVNELLRVINPTLNYQVGDIGKLPVIVSQSHVKNVESLSNNSIQISTMDWDSNENSWDFKRNPMLVRGKLADAYATWKADCESRFLQLKGNEEELNRIFIDIYGLQEELTPDVADKDVTVHRVFDTKDDVPESMKGSNYVRTMQDEVVSLISYAVGCMFGRYSLDIEGLAYAGGDWDSSKYTTFIPDEDNCIPITDEEYFEDDIVGLFCSWLKKVYGEETLEENLDFIANALGNKGKTSREIIRNYFLTDFIKDHNKTYQKRPIYWLFDSGKQNGFKALIYMHRYNADTVGNIRVEYLHRMQHIYESEMNRMQDMMDHSDNAREVAAASKRKEKLGKQLKECREYDEKIGHLALSRVEIDLDDGVKYNYRKVQTAYDGKFYEVLADSKNIMMDAKKYKEFKNK